MVRCPSEYFVNKSTNTYVSFVRRAAFVGEVRMRQRLVHLELDEFVELVQVLQCTDPPEGWLSPLPSLTVPMVWRF